MKLVKGVVDEKGNVITFMNDRDGFSAKDFIMMVTIGLFSLSFITALILIVLGREINDSFFRLMEVGKPVFITVIGGVMSVQFTEAITSTLNNRHTKKNKESGYDVQNDSVG